MTDTASLLKDGLPEGISAALNKLLTNPQLMGMIASTINDTSSPNTKKDGSSTTDEEASESPQELPTLSPDVILPLVGKLSQASNSSGRSEQEALLCAIKPYLSPKRCQVIDSIIRISKMSAIVRQIK